MDLTERLRKYVPGLNGWAEINNQNHVLAAFDCLDANDLSYEVDILLLTDDFSDEDPDELAESLVEMYANLRNPSEFTSLDLISGWGDDSGGGGTLEDFVYYARYSGVPNDSIASFLLELVNDNDNAYHRLEDYAETLYLYLTAILHIKWGKKIEFISDANGNIPCDANSYLLSEDYKTFSGVFVSDDKQYSFKIVNDTTGNWTLSFLP
jgi:hypothetical protein